VRQELTSVKLAHGTVHGSFCAMSATITVDAAGRFVLPKSIRDRLHLRAGTRLRADVVADRIELTPEPDADVRIEQRGKRMVIVGGGRFDAVQAVKAAREERDAQLAQRTRLR
jgi:AbrB family looped-hinge helix DNA binding protein